MVFFPDKVNRQWLLVIAMDKLCIYDCWSDKLLSKTLKIVGSHEDIDVCRGRRLEASHVVHLHEQLQDDVLFARLQSWLMLDWQCKLANLIFQEIRILENYSPLRLCRPCGPLIGLTIATMALCAPVLSRKFCLVAGSTSWNHIIVTWILLSVSFLFITYQGWHGQPDRSYF